MKTSQTGVFRTSSSAPLPSSDNTGTGSIIAGMISRGVGVSRYTPQGTMKPFGQDVGTADDSSVTTDDFAAQCTGGRKSSGE